MGVQNIWLIDPIYRAAFTFDSAGLHEADPTRLTVPNTPIHLDLTEAFAAIDRCMPSFLQITPFMHVRELEPAVG